MRKAGFCALLSLFAILTFSCGDREEQNRSDSRVGSEETKNRSVASSPATATARVIRFPEGPARWELYAFDPDDPQISHERLRYAAGHVTVPAGKSLRLVAHFKENETVDLSPFESLPRGAIRHLLISSENPCNEPLESIASLTSLRTLNVASPGITDAGMAHLRRLKSLENLRLSADQRGISKLNITDESLKHLRELTSLTSLDLSGTNITGSGLRHIRGATGMQHLRLSSAPVTDEHLAHIANLTSLQSLFLDYTQITDAGMAHLEGLTALQSLWLMHTRITDRGLVHLSGMQELRDLGLSATQVTGPGFAHLSHLSKLENLYLDGTTLDDTVVPHLLKLDKSLRFVRLENARISPAALEELKAGLNAFIHEPDDHRDRW